MSERLRLVNHAAVPVSVDVDLELGADGADIFEVRGYPGRPVDAPAGRLAERRITFRYDGLDRRQRLTHVASARRGSTARPCRSCRPDRPTRAPSSGSTGPWRSRPARCATWPGPSGRPSGPTARGGADEPTGRGEAAALFPDPPRISSDEGTAAYHAWERGTTKAVSDHELFNLVIKRSVADLRLLVNEGPGPNERYVAAGVPWFTTLFGRDSLITAIQALAFRPQIAVETLQVLADHQATEVDDWRDAEPGKILHELRTGEMARVRGAAAHAVLRLDRLDAAVPDPARRDVRLDRRPGAGRPPVAERDGRAVLDRH